MPLTIFCGCTARFAFDLFGIPKDRFSHDTALLVPHVTRGPMKDCFSGQFFRILEENKFCFVFAISNIVHDVETMYGFC